MKVLLLNLPVPDYYNDFQNGSNNLFCDMVSSVIRKDQISHIEIVKFDKDILDIYIDKKKPVMGFDSGVSSFLDLGKTENLKVAESLID